MRTTISATVLSVLTTSLLHGSEPENLRLTVVTYNVQFLPKIARIFNARPDVHYRAETIGKQLQDFDLIGLNEVFDEEPRDLLFATLKASFGDNYHQFVPPPDTQSKFGIGSGLAVVSRFPVVDSHYLRFGSGGRPLRNLLFADGVAAKGAIHVRLRLLPEEDFKSELDVYVTHLESRDVILRSQQYRALGQFIGKYKVSARPVLILGDLNINGGKQAQDNESSEYNKMLIFLREQLPNHEITDVWIQLGEGEGVTADWDEEDGGNRIDYVLIANPKGRTPRLQPQSIRVNKYCDEYVGTLSDHAAVEVEFKWQRQ